MSPQAVKVTYLNNGLRRFGENPTRFEAHPEIKIVVLSLGEAALELGDRCHILRAPCAVVTTPYLQHRFVGPKVESEVLVTMLVQLGSPWYEHLFPRAAPRVFDLTAETLQSLLLLHEALIREQHQQDALSGPASKALLNSWLTLLLRSRDTHLKPAPATHFHSLPEEVAARVSESVSVRELAGKTGLSESAFRRRFVKEFGCTPKDSLHVARIRRAAHLLDRTELKISVISGACGFSSLQSFSKFFRQHTGMSPRSWRDLPRHHPDKARVLQRR